MDMDMDVIFHIHGNPENRRENNSQVWWQGRPAWK